MKATIHISSSYGFDHNWTLICQTKKVTKSFYLGQDVKFCWRVLGLEPRHVVQEIGTDRLDTEDGRNKLAKFICEQLGLNGRNIKKYQSWELCSQ
jgi:hypothetical protein